MSVEIVVPLPAHTLAPALIAKKAEALLFQQPLACSSFSEMWRMG